MPFQEKKYRSSDPNETTFLFVIDGIKYRNELAHFSNRNWMMDSNRDQSQPNEMGIFVPA